MDRRDFPAVHLRNISQMRHIGKVPFGYGDGRFFQSRWPRPDGYRTGKQPEGTRRSRRKASQLNVRHGPGCRVPSRQAPLPALSPQCPAVRQPQYHFFTSSSTALPQTIRVWERRSISRRISIPALCSSGTLYIQKQRQIQERADWGKSPPHKQDGSSGPPAPYQHPARRSMRRSGTLKVVSLVEPPFLFLV